MGATLVTKSIAGGLVASVALCQCLTWLVTWSADSARAWASTHWRIQFGVWKIRGCTVAMNVRILIVIPCRSGAHSNLFRVMYVRLGRFTMLYVSVVVMEAVL